MNNRLIYTFASVVCIVSLFLGSKAGMALQTANATVNTNVKTFVEVSGKVLDKADASSYTYLHLKTATGETWAAVPQSDIKVGTMVKILNPVAMDGFQSKTLKRKFEHIYFGTLDNQGSQSAGSGAAEMKAEVHPKVASFSAGKDLQEIQAMNIKKAEGNNGHTVSDLFSNHSLLKDKEVSVRGKVVKYNPAILGKNWIHVVDGSGSADKKDFDITVVSLDEAKIGDLVTVTGKLHIDKKLDPYFFPVIIEDAKLLKASR